jgi:riboflavin kinase/FMN adenylyltransferase
MELVRYLHNIKSRHRGCVLTIGNFDGVHLGHQAVIKQLSSYASDIDLPAVVLTFEPQPLEYFSPETAPARLSSFREKISWLKEYDIERVICLRFQHELATLEPELFVEEILVNQIGVRFIVIGDDFRFGKRRAGDFKLLQSLGVKFGFDVIATSTLECDGERISSSLIREHLSKGKLEETSKLLGRPYSMMGRVIHGDERGRQLGFPTANIAIKRALSPLLGVFAVTVYGHGDRVLNGVANIGTRPVFEGQQVLLEVHLLDFDSDIYGSYLRVEFNKKIRAEVKFDSVDQLVAQITIDKEQSREYFTKPDIAITK